MARPLARAALAALLLAARAAANPAAPQLGISHRTAAFWYGWYGTPAHDGKWSHWDHTVLPHWREDVHARYPAARFVPPEDLHSPFYPQRGPYSSADPAVIGAQMRQMAAAGIGIAIVSWWGRPGVSKGDSQGVVNDALMGAVLDGAAAAGVRVALHLEPYEGRSVDSVRADLQHLSAAYGNHSALLRAYPQRFLGRVPRAGDERIVYFVYDSYHVDAREWERLLGPIGSETVRGTPLDGVFIGLWLDAHHGDHLRDGGFDGA